MQGELCSRLEELIYISLTRCCLVPALGGEEKEGV